MTCRTDSYQTGDTFPENISAFEHIYLLLSCSFGT